MVWERKGKHFEYDKKWKEYLQPEQRVHQGQLGSRKMDYAPSAIMHQRDIPSSELERISRTHKIHQIEEKLKLIHSLNSKIVDMTHTKMKLSMKLMFKNLGMNIKQILDETKEDGVDPTDLVKFKDYLVYRLQNKRDELRLELRKAKKDFDAEAVKSKLEDAFNDLDYQVNDVQRTREDIAKDLENISKLYQYLEQNNSSENMPYTAEMDELVRSLSSEESILSKLEQRRDEITKQIEPLKEKEEIFKGELDKVRVEIDKIKEFSKFYSENTSAYMVIGLPPDHEVSLPLAVNGQRGLHPLAMLQKMRELATGEKQFDLQTHNCSLTSIEVLTAGASHDPLLKSIMGKRALGFLGTPQQVLENAKLARAAISEEKKSNIFTKLEEFRPLDRALGYAMEVYMEPNASKAKQNAGLVLAAVVGLAKLPGIIVSSLINPIEAFESTLKENPQKVVVLYPQSTYFCYEIHINLQRRCIKTAFLRLL